MRCVLLFVCLAGQVAVADTNPSPDDMARTVRALAHDGQCVKAVDAAEQLRALDPDAYTEVVDTIGRCRGPLEARTTVESPSAWRHFYASVSGWAGATTLGHSTPMSLRGAVGAKTDPQADVAGRMGVTLDLTGMPGTFFGGEAQVDFRVSPKWHLGPRIAAGSPGDHVRIGMAGLRLRSDDDFSVGIDMVGLRTLNPDGMPVYDVAVLAGAELTGKPGSYLVGAGVGVSVLALVGVLVLTAGHN